jgi:hypothetical protein
MVTNTGKHAKRELDILLAAYPDKENPAIIAQFYDEILALCEKYGLSGQSGGSAAVVVPSLAESIKILLSNRILTPLTGEDSEWSATQDKAWVQNNRLSTVFKVNGIPMYSEAVLFKTEHEGLKDRSAKLDLVTDITSMQRIKSFPFTPKTFYIDVVKKAGNWVVKDKKQLKPVYNYYE